MNKAVAIVAIASAFTASTRAQVQAGAVQWHVGHGPVRITWSPAAAVSPGDTVYFRGKVSWTETGPTVGFAACSWDQLDLAGSNATDVISIATYPAPPADDISVKQGTGASQGGKKIDGLFDSVTLGQQPAELPGGFLNPAFSSHNPYWPELKIKLVAGSAVGPIVKTRRVIAFQGVWVQFGNPATNYFSVYTTPTGSSKKPAVEATQSPAYLLIRSGTCDGDLDGDGDSDRNDWIMFLDAYEAEDLAVDFNQDGAVDIDDFNDFLDILGSC